MWFEIHLRKYQERKTQFVISIWFIYSYAMDIYLSTFLAQLNIKCCDCIICQIAKLIGMDFFDIELLMEKVKKKQEI